MRILTFKYPDVKVEADSLSIVEYPEGLVVSHDGLELLGGKNQIVARETWPVNLYITYVFAFSDYRGIMRLFLVLIDDKYCKRHRREVTWNRESLHGVNNSNTWNCW